MKKLFAVVMLVLVGSTLFAQSPCPFKYGANEKDSLEGAVQTTNFNLFYKAKNYTEAYDAWQYIVNHCPCAWDGVYTNAQNMFDNLLKDPNLDSLRRERLIDSLIYSYEVRGTYFPEKFSKGSAPGFKAYNLLRYRSKAVTSNIDQLNNILSMFIESVELDKENTQPAIWDKYFQFAESMTKATKDTSIVIEAYGRATDYLDISINNSLAQYEKQATALDTLTAQRDRGEIDQISYDKQANKMVSDTTRQQKLVANYRKTLNKIEKSVTPYASCEVLEEIYSKKFESIKSDISAVNKMVLTMYKSGCLTSPLYKDALAIVHENNPSRTTAYQMGNLSLLSYTKEKNNAELEKAVEYFQEASKLSELNDQKADANYMLAMCYYLKGSYSEARSAAYVALKYKPNMGKAYLLIGDMYKGSAGRCSGDDLPLACCWAAADKYAKAVAVDPGCADEAAKHREGLRFPSKDDCFKRGLNSGDSYHVGCWIQENTTVR